MRQTEQRTAATILQKPLEVQAGGKTYQVARPTFGTLIEISRYVKQLPKATGVKKKDVVPYILSVVGESGEIVAKIAALLIIGESNITYRTERRAKRRFLCFKTYEKETVSNVDDLAGELMRTASPEEMDRIISQALSFQDIGFFLSTIISLGAANVLEPTRSETEATASGA